MTSALSILIIGAAVVGAGLFAGAETGMYQLSRVRLRLGVERKQGLSRLLSHTLRDPGGMLVATLIGTNLCVHLATSTITMMLLDQAGTAHAAEWIATGIATPILFVFSELIPKNLFLFRSDVLLPAVSPLLYATHQVFRWCGAVALLQYLSSVFARLTGTPRPSKVAAESMRRHEIAVILQETQEEGFLTGLQTGMMNRLVIASTTPVKAVMTRLKEVEKIDVHSNRDALLQMLKSHEFTRVLVYEGTPDHILGFVNVLKTLGAHPSFETLRDYIRPITTVDAEIFVTDAIDLMQQKKLRILLITQSLSKKPASPLGIVTMKDLAEELLGELTAW